MGLSSQAFIKEIQQMVRNKHSKNHPIIGLIEDGTLSRDQLKGFVGQFYLFFPKPFPKPIAAMLSRCPDDPELEKMWIENVVEEGTGEITGTDSHKGLFIRFAQVCGYGKDELDRVQPLPETQAFLDWRELLMYQRTWLELYACQALWLSARLRGYSLLDVAYGGGRGTYESWPARGGALRRHRAAAGGGARFGAKNPGSVLARFRRYQAGVRR
jgi:thiaminase